MQRVAIVGTGISGLSAAYLLSRYFDVTLFEQNDYLGGHSRTIEVDEANNKYVPIDTGFIVFNHYTYPLLNSLFKALNVPTHKSKMSFGVSINQRQLEYGSGSINALFSQRKNLFKPKFWRLIWDLFKFNRRSEKHIKQDTLSSGVTLAEYLDDLKVGEWFKHYYLLPMGAAIWSTPLKKIYHYPAKTFIQFFNNHGLLKVNNPIQWYTVVGGSRVYVEKIKNILLKNGVKIKSGAKKIDRNTDGVTITDATDRVCGFDQLILACHSDEALALLSQPSKDEQRLLSQIQYQPNRIVLHKDSAYMPKSKLAWSSWVYHSKEKLDGGNQVSLTYWMNNLQRLDTNTQYFVTVNPDSSINDQLIINDHQLDHPLFNQQAFDAQTEIQEIQGQNCTYFCGAYLRHGFHEDGIWSAVKVAKCLGVECPW